MNVQERTEIGRMGECIQQLAVEIARLSQAVEPLSRLQQEQDSLRDRIAQLEGFRAAILWLSGIGVVSIALRFLMSLWVSADSR
jgi:hypothetical protein